ncbi:fibronectin type III domain-containing protein [Kribbella sp. NPDC051620]|uniref:fibronectin type III domain-containing protein n=1 Tax=Kribbella sp. NPDC051620 TaxID=3364120 RepID=UPI0037B24FA4
MSDVKPIWRARAALAAVVAVCMVATVVAVSGAGASNAGMRFVQSGHLVYNSTLGKVFHIDGGTKSVDSEVDVPGAEPGSPSAQSDQNGFVLADGRTIEWGKSDLKVLDPQPAPSTEKPVALEVAGVVYAVYRKSGSVVRLGGERAVMTTAGPLGQPVATSDGTVWVYGLESGQVCQAALQATRLTCTAKVPLGHAGMLTLIGNQPVFLDLDAKELREVGQAGFGRKMSLEGVQLSPNSIVAANDVAGRVAILDPQKNVLQLVDASPLTSGSTPKAPVKPTAISLGAGRYDQIASSGTGLALIDTSGDGTVVTLDRDGKQQQARKIPTASKQAPRAPGDRPRLSRGGDSRLYVDGVAGEHVMVVEGNGQVTEVATNGEGGQKTPKPGKPKPSQPVPPSSKPTKPVEPSGTNGPPQPPRTRQPEGPGQPQGPGKPEGSGKPKGPEKPGGTEKPEPPPPTKTAPPKPPAPPTITASRPGAPRNVSAKAGNASASITWGAAAANGAAITSYVVTWAGGSKTVAGSVRGVTATGLTNGQSYSFAVRALNRVGTGPSVSSARVTLGAAADAPGRLTANPSSGAVTLSWRRPNLNGGTLVSYGISQNGDSRKSTGTSYRWTGLTNGKRYTFVVTTVTKTADGRVLVGAGATVSATPTAPGGNGRLRISKGTAVDSDPDVCEPGKCFNIHIRATGLQPNTTYMFQGHTTNYGELHKDGPEGIESDSQGVIDVQKFYNDDTEGQVWVTATGPGIPPKSNVLDW